IGARNDGDHYGELFVYQFPKQKNIYGPQQIENRINQDSVISQELNLWSQGGSEVIRGNLLVIPIEDTVLYVEPVYIESSNETSLPEVKQVIMAYGDYIVMEETFEESLEKIVSYIDSDVEPPTTPDAEEGLEDDPTDEETGEDVEEDIEEEMPEQPPVNAEETLQEAGKLLEEYQKATMEGDYEKADAILEQLEEEPSQFK